MGIDTAADFLNALRQSRLLEADQLDGIARGNPGQFPDARALARHLIQKSLLTPYQVNQIFQGQMNSLVLGQYRLLERLGEGGMGQVFKARHQAMGRIVALKVIRKDRVENAEAIKRFRREIQAVSQLHHPNVVLAYDADSVGNTHFFVMEYVNGIDLSRLVKEKGPLPVGLACECIRQAACGLAHAHEKGLIHRDIKPGNLLLTSSAEQAANGQSVTEITSKSTIKRSSAPVIKVLDMGLARLHGVEGDDNPTSLSADGSVLGTPDFMAPEQAKNSRIADARADVYSLGCTLYYLLTRQPPFPGGTNIEKLLKHQMDPPPLIEQLRPDVPDGVRKALARMLAKKPEERFQTAGDAAAALAPHCRTDGTPSGELPTGAITALPATASLGPVGGTAATLLAPARLKMGAAAVATPDGTEAPTQFQTLAASLKRAGRRRWPLVAAGALAGVFLLCGGLLMLAAFKGKAPDTRAVAGATERQTVPSTEGRPVQPETLPLIKYLPENTCFVVVCNLSQTLSAPVFKQYQHRMPGLNLGEFRQQTQAMGIDLDRDVARFIVAQAGPGEFENLLVVLQASGPLDAAKVQTALKKNAVRTHKGEGGREVYEWSDRKTGKNIHIALAGRSAVLLSPNLRLVNEGLTRVASRDRLALQDRDLQRVLESPDARSNLFVAVGGSFAFIKGGGDLTDLLHIKVIAGSAALGQDVRVQAEARFDSAEHARNFRNEAIRHWTNILRQKQQGPLADELQDANIVLARDKPTVTIETTIKAEKLDKLLPTPPR